MGIYSEQQRLCERAVEQFKDRLNEPGAGWAVRSLTPDTGSDLQVEVFDDGEPSGLRFEVQMKGVGASSLPGTKDTVRHRFKSRDLEHFARCLGRSSSWFGQFTFDVACGGRSTTW